MTALNTIWGGLSSLIALLGLAIAVVSLRHSHQVQEQALAFANLDQKIELAIQRFNDTLDAKLQATFVNAQNLKLQLDLYEQRLAGFDHRLRRNSINVTIVTRELMKKGYTLSMQPGDVIDDLAE